MELIYLAKLPDLLFSWIWSFTVTRSRISVLIRLQRRTWCCSILWYSQIISPAAPDLWWEAICDHCKNGL